MPILMSKYGTTTSESVDIKEGDSLEVVLKQNISTSLFRPHVTPVVYHGRVIGLNKASKALFLKIDNFVQGCAIGKVYKSLDHVKYDFSFLGNTFILPDLDIKLRTPSQQPVDMNTLSYSKESKGYSWVQVKPGDVISTNKNKHYSVLYITDSTLLVQRSDEEEPILIRISDSSAMKAFNLKYVQKF
ncbi:hypothetical protein SJ_234 [Proteus phage SJ_PmiM]|nr:hypothetical protein SJ_234 [Proteus phage SJ_PmiM]